MAQCKTAVTPLLNAMELLQSCTKPSISFLIEAGLLSWNLWDRRSLQYAICTVYPTKYAHSFCFAVLCCGYTLTDFPISIRLTSLALWQSNDCPSASKATLMNMDKYFMWIHYERLHNHNKAKHNKTVCIFLGIYCMYSISEGICSISEGICTQFIQHCCFGTGWYCP